MMNIFCLYRKQRYSVNARSKLIIKVEYVVCVRQAAPSLIIHFFERLLSISVAQAGINTTDIIPMTKIPAHYGFSSSEDKS